jgi:hypothetical protein
MTAPLNFCSVFPAYGKCRELPAVGISGSLADAGIRPLEASSVTVYVVSGPGSDGPFRLPRRFRMPVTLYSKETSRSRISVGSFFGLRSMAKPEVHPLAARLSLEDQINNPTRSAFWSPFGFHGRCECLGGQPRNPPSTISPLRQPAFTIRLPVPFGRLWTEAQGRSPLPASGGFDETTPAPSRTA